MDAYENFKSILIFMAEHDHLESRVSLSPVERENLKHQNIKIIAAHAMAVVS
jgi:hypothetical protein